MILATHVILTGYGHWLPNDVRGSYSETVFIPPIAELGPLHHGRKPVQPSTPELRKFHNQAQAVLTHSVHWFSTEERNAIRDAFARLCQERRFVCYAGAILSNHIHVLIERNYLPPPTIHDLLKQYATQAVRAFGFVPVKHPVFNAGIATVYKYTPAEIRQCAKYITDNFAKHKFPTERYEFVSDYKEKWMQRRITYE
ncbi:MAG: hypothetical protein FWE88_00375 [Phycisphaerae bacterium]|nr:hypothetical protein [Phycisphaerae bacterium]